MGHVACAHVLRLPRFAAASFPGGKGRQNKTPPGRGSCGRGAGVRGHSGVAQPAARQEAHHAQAHEHQRHGAGLGHGGEDDVVDGGAEIAGAAAE